MTGSPAIDGLDEMREMSRERCRAADGRDSSVLVMLHFAGCRAMGEPARAGAVIGGVTDAVRGMWLRCRTTMRGVSRCWTMSPAVGERGGRWIEHLPRERFVGPFSSMRERGGVLVGNSSAGADRVRALRGRGECRSCQNGRERSGNVVDVASADRAAVAEAIGRARGLHLSGHSHPYGDGDAGKRIAGVIAGVDIGSAGFLRKCNSLLSREGRKSPRVVDDETDWVGS
ncbi:MAG: hypothetical protein R3B46_09960 [Phycisphaerales bacterium]